MIVKEALEDKRVKEGHNETTLKCVVDNPKGHKVSWTKNGQPINEKDIKKLVIY